MADMAFLRIIRVVTGMPALTKAWSPVKLSTARIEEEE